MALTLLAVAVPLTVSLIPTSLSAMRRAQIQQMATDLASYQMDECHLLPGHIGPDVNQTIKLGGQQFWVCRESYALDTYRVETVVAVTPLQARAPAVRLTTHRLKLEQP